MSTLLITLLNSMCTSQIQTSLFKSDCNGQLLELRLVTKNTFETVYHHHELLYGDELVDVIDNRRLGTTPPYAPEVYGKAPWHLLDTTRQFYRPAGFSGPVKKIKAMLFIDPKNWSPQAFEQLYTCLKQSHKSMQESMMKKPDFQPYQFAGMVYGLEETFTQQYRKNQNDYFTIYPDGRIAHTLVESLMTTTSSNGLGDTVLMPGKRILVDTAQISLDDLQTYRNPKTNRSLAIDFDLQADTTFHSR